MSAARQSIQTLQAQVGEQTGLSNWLVIDQARIDVFAEVTDDKQFIHIDPAQASAETDFGGTIAHGFLSVSLLSVMLNDVLPEMAGRRMIVNYGFDRLRFLSPVRSGSRVRGRFFLKAVDERKSGEVTVTFSVTVEIENADRPALAADWITRFYFEGADAA